MPFRIAAVENYEYISDEAYATEEEARTAISEYEIAGPDDMNLFGRCRGGNGITYHVERTSN